MSYETTDPARARVLLDEQDHRYVDVRTVEEFEAGHVPGAYNVPLLERGPAGMEPNPDFLAVIQRHFGPEQRLVLGCKVGGRSARACELLAASGYTALVNMDGGFSGRQDEVGRLVQEGWVGHGFPTASEARAERTWSALKGG